MKHISCSIDKTIHLMQETYKIRKLLKLLVENIYIIPVIITIVIKYVWVSISCPFAHAYI